MKTHKEFNEKFLEAYFQWKENPTDKNFDNLFLLAHPFMGHIFKKYRFLDSNQSYEDFVSQFYIYLKRLKRLERYDLERGPLSTFFFLEAKACILREDEKRRAKKNKVLQDGVQLSSDKHDDFDTFLHGYEEDSVEKSDYYYVKLKLLCCELSSYELLCLYFYLQKYSYLQIVSCINSVVKKEGWNFVFREVKNSEKSVDNAIFRIKAKGKKIDFDF